MSEYLERESKWDVDEAFELPAFDDMYQGVRVARSTVELTSTYFDTTELDLLTHGLTLRQRLGDDDTGWQLKVPADDGRTEIRADVSETVPDDIAEVVEGVRLGKELNVVATVQTTRDRYRLLNGQGEVLAEVADDHVRATTPSRPDEKLLWREIEVEAGPAGDDLSEIAERLARAGAKESVHASKLTHALRTDRRRESAPNGGQLGGYIRTQVDAVFAGDIGLRRKLDPIHDTRVAIRRLRSTLRVFRKSFDTMEIDSLEAELKWFGTQMGGVRDCHVQRKRFASAIRELEVKLVIGPISSRLDEVLASRQDDARRDLATAMDSARYSALLATLQRWSATPPIGEHVTPKALRKQAHGAARKAGKRLAKASDDTELHKARKAAKRARYAFELVAAKQKAKRFKKIQRVLGENQDSVVARETLLDIAASADTGDLNAFTLGVLYVEEMQRGARSRKAARRL